MPIDLNDAIEAASEARDEAEHEAQMRGVESTFVVDAGDQAFVRTLWERLATCPDCRAVGDAAVAQAKERGIYNPVAEFATRVAAGSNCSSCSSGYRPFAMIRCDCDDGYVIVPDAGDGQPSLTDCPKRCHGLGFYAEPLTVTADGRMFTTGHRISAEEARRRFDEARPDG